MALIAAGCGGGGEADPLSKTAFVKQGNSICAQAIAERESAMSDTSKEITQEELSSEAELEKFVTDAALPPVQQMAEELGDLGAPKGDEKKVEAIVTGFEGGVEKGEADPNSVVSGAAFAGANKLALAYGLTECQI
jgi:hypothetical protein